MENKVFEKHYLKLWEQYFLIFTINQELYGRQSNDYKKKEAKEKIKQILEEIYKLGYQQCETDISNDDRYSLREDFEKGNI